MLLVGNTYEGKKTFQPDKFQTLETTIPKPPHEHQDNDGTWWLIFSDTNGKKVHVRQLELARVLFLHNTHLTRAAFRPQGLGSLAHSKSEEAHISEINFHLLADYPASNLHSQRTLDHLVWLFFENNAKRSFHSVFSCMQQDSSQNWNFRFSPPEMLDWKFEVRGRHLDDSNFIADSIRKITHPGMSIFREFIFKHPRFRQPITRGEKSKKTYAYTPPDENPTLDIPSTPGLNRRLHRENDRLFTFEIPHISRTSVYGKSSQGGSTKNDTNDSKNEIAGVGHADTLGKC